MADACHGPGRARHRRVARHRPRRGAGARRGRRPCRCGRAHRRRAGGARRRDPGAAGGSATLVPLDLKDGAGIDRLGAALYERWGRLDILLGNAGDARRDHAARPSRAEGLRRGDGGQRHRQLAPDPLARSAAPRSPMPAAPCSSRRAPPHLRRPYWGAYSASKAALEALVPHLCRARCASTNVRVNLFNPGPLRTRMRAQAMPGEDPDDAAAARVGRAGYRAHAVAGLHRERHAFRFFRSASGRRAASSARRRYRGGARGLSRLAGIRVVALPQHQPDRHAREFEVVADGVDEVAAVGVGKCFRPRAEGDEGRRPRLRLGEVAELDAPAGDRRRRMTLDHRRRASD